MRRQRSDWQQKKQKESCELKAAPSVLDAETRRKLKGVLGMRLPSLEREQTRQKIKLRDIGGRDVILN